MAWANAQWPQAQFDFRGAHVDAVNPTLEEFTKLAARYPEAVRRLRYVGTYQGVGAPEAVPFEEGEYAHALHSGRTLGLNPRFYGDPVELLGRMNVRMALGNSPNRCNRMDYPVTHEFGHLVLWSLPVEEASDMAVWLTQAFPPDGVSRYAQKSVEEAFAEGFAAMRFQPKGDLPLFV